MGFSVAGASGIVFIALIVAFSVVTGVIYKSMESFDESTEADMESQIERRSTEFTIKNIIYNRTNNRTVLKLRNTGSTVVNMTKTEVLLDGHLIDEGKISYDLVDKEGHLWAPEENIRVIVEGLDIDFRDKSDYRIDVRVSKDLSAPESLSTNSDYTYLIQEGNLKIYDHDQNLIKTVSGGEMTRARDVASTFEHVYVLDDHDHVDRYDEKGSNSTVLIPSGGSLSSPSSIAVTDENTNDYIYMVGMTGGNYHVDRYALNGTRIGRLLTTSDRIIDIYVTDHVYAVLETGSGREIHRWGLDGTGGTTLISSGGHNTRPTNITVEDQNFSDPYIYVVDSNSHIDVYNETGVFQRNISSGLGSNLWGIDVAGKVQVSNGANGYYILNKGAKIKVVLENAISEYETI